VNSILKQVSPSPTTMIRMDHTHVLATFHRYHIDTPAKTKRSLVNLICSLLEVHAQLEEEIFYPAMRDLASDGALVDKSFPEHAEMKRLIAQLREMEPHDPRYDETVMELMRDVIHHVADEETMLLPDAERRLGDRLGELGAQMTKRRLELTAPRVGEMARNAVTAMPVSSMVLTAGAVVAGAYLVTRAFGREA
jgi:hemerythrin superfamily protein